MKSKEVEKKEAHVPVQQTVLQRTSTWFACEQLHVYPPPAHHHPLWRRKKLTGILSLAVVWVRFRATPAINIWLLRFSLNPAHVGLPISIVKRKALFIFSNNTCYPHLVLLLCQTKLGWRFELPMSQRHEVEQEGTGVPGPLIESTLPMIFPDTPYHGVPNSGSYDPSRSCCSSSSSLFPW